jgi:DNA polymerase-1
MAHVTSEMERYGVGFDATKCPPKVAECQARLEELVSGPLNGWSGTQPINWGSWQQIAQFLYGSEEAPAVKGGPPIVPRGFGLPPVSGNLRAVKVRKEKERPTGEAALAHLEANATNRGDREGLQALMEWKKVKKLLGFFEGLPNFAASDGRIHPQLGPAAETGRLTCKNPNLQNQPPGTRDIFVASPGNVLICRDFDGLEWRILAHILAFRYGDMSLVDEIVAGIDPHSATAVRIYDALGQPLDCDVGEVKETCPKQRAAAKIINYSINYGKTARGLGIQLRNDDGEPIGETVAQRMLDAFYESNPGIERWHRDCVQYARDTGHASTLLGRTREIPELQAKSWWIREKGKRLAMNTPIQGSAADIVGMAMLRCNASPHPDLVKVGHFNEALYGLKVKQILQVHDELLFECPEENAEKAEKEIAKQMDDCLKGVREFLCPLSTSGSIGPDWKEAAGK